MIFVDSNIPMYLVGAQHPNRERAAMLLRQLVAQHQRLVTSSEVYQEILHRYQASQVQAADDAFEVLDTLADDVVSVDRGIVVVAKDVLHQHPGVSARDAVHVATMQAHDIDRILTFDRGFDEVPGLERLS